MPPKGVRPKAGAKQASDRETLAGKAIDDDELDADKKSGNKGVKRSAGNSFKGDVTTLAMGAARPNTNADEKQGKRPKLMILICGRCSKRNQGPDCVIWVKLPSEEGELIDMGNACLKCWRAFLWAWRVLGYEWTWLCAKCKEDPRDITHRLKQLSPRHNP